MKQAQKQTLSNPLPQQSKRGSCSSVQPGGLPTNCYPGEEFTTLRPKGDTRVGCRVSPVTLDIQVLTFTWPPAALSPGPREDSGRLTELQRPTVEAASPCTLKLSPCPLLGDPVETGQGTESPALPRPASARGRSPPPYAPSAHRGDGLLVSGFHATRWLEVNVPAQVGGLPELEFDRGHLGDNGKRVFFLGLRAASCFQLVGKSSGPELTLAGSFWL